MKKVLLIEDAMLPAYAIKSHLARTGYQTVEVLPDANAALLAVQFYRPDLVIMDVDREGEWDGVALMALIRRFSDIPVIYTASHLDVPTRERAALTTRSCLMGKPLNQQLLMHYISHFLNAGKTCNIPQAHNALLKTV